MGNSVYEEKKISLLIQYSFKKIIKTFCMYDPNAFLLVKITHVDLYHTRMASKQKMHSQNRVKCMNRTFTTKHQPETNSS